MKDLDWSDVAADSRRMEDERRAERAQMPNEPEYAIGDGPGTEEWVPDYEPEDDPEYQAYLEREHARGPLAFEPETMPCYGCCGWNGVDSIERKVVKVLRPREGVFDPTTAYELECGHTAI